MFFVTYDLYFDHAATYEVPVPQCPCCGKAATVRLELSNLRVGCFMLELSMPSLPKYKAQCMACRAEIKKKSWPAEVASVFDREKHKHRTKFSFRFTKFFKILLLVLILGLVGKEIYDRATLPIEWAEIDDAYVVKSLQNVQPGMVMAISTSLSGKHYRLPILVTRVEGDIIYGRPYKTPPQDYDFMKNDLDLSDANFPQEGSLVLQQSKYPKDLILKEVNGVPVPSFTPRVSVHRVYHRP